MRESRTLNNEGEGNTDSRTGYRQQQGRSIEHLPSLWKHEIWKERGDSNFGFVLVGTLALPLFDSMAVLV